MYALAAFEPARFQLQILHDFDSCCFSAAGLCDRHHGLQSLGAAAVDVHGWMQTAVTSGNAREVNPRSNQVLVAYLVEKLLRHWKLLRADFELLPFDNLRVDTARDGAA